MTKVVELELLPIPIMLKSTHGLLVRDWKEDVVQLVQFPRTHTIVSPSPFALKLETWIRMNNIKYHNVNNEWAKASSKGQVPFIELNGRQFADSNFIIEHLRSHFKVPMDGQLNTNERAQLRAFQVLIEESLFRCLAYERAKDFKWLATDKGALPTMPGVKKFIFKNVGISFIENAIKKVVKAQGYGRHSQEEIEEIAKKDLVALSTLLGEKPFLFGESPTTLDATLFAHLVQFTDTPLSSDVYKTFIEKSTPNLADFVKRVKERYWQDWNQIKEHLAMNPEDLLPKEEKVPEGVAVTTTTATVTAPTS